MTNGPCYCPDMRSRARPTDLGPFRAEHLRSGDPYELSDGHPIYCAPTGGRGSDPNRLGASVVGWDPNVKEAGVDTGYSLKPGTLRAPDVAVGNVPNKPGWVSGAPELAIEYADVGQDEATLQKKIVELLEAGTKVLWVVRLTGLRRVEVYEPRKKMRTVHPGHFLSAPGILKNPVRVEALYDRDEAERATLTNLLQRRGYHDLDAVLAEGREQGLLLGKRDALKRVLAQRGLRMTKEIAAAIEACTDARKLDRWLDRALVASSAAAVFKQRSRGSSPA